LWPTAGQLRAISLASSRSGTSMMPKPPPIVSLVSMKGPSVITDSPLRQEMGVAVRAGWSCRARRGRPPTHDRVHVALAVAERLPLLVGADDTVEVWPAR